MDLDTDPRITHAYSASTRAGLPFILDEKAKEKKHIPGKRLEENKVYCAKLWWSNYAA